MSKRKQKGDTVKQFIIKHISDHSGDIARFVCEKFDISRQAANRHLRQLVSDGALIATGSTRNRRYSLAPLVEKIEHFPIVSTLQEDKVWRERVEPLLTGVPENVLDICHYGFTEIFNNVIEHSEGSNVSIGINYTPAMIEIDVRDDGVGVFNKITKALRLDDERHAILELAKGKLTTQPETHTGEGIFFSSRMFDNFSMLSGRLFFQHDEPGDDWLLEDHEEKNKGTFVAMKISPHSKRTSREVFDKHGTIENPLSFSSTHVPVLLAQYGDENLVSRSQARRLLARFERFEEVFLDFKGVRTVGPAFVDEIFRVFRNHNPRTRILWIRANKAVENMIKRVATDDQGQLPLISD